jgi:DNA-binding MarR family transcriptional regulator
MSKAAPSSSPQRGTPSDKRASKAVQPPGYYKGTAESLGPEGNLGHLIKLTQTSLNRIIDQRMAPIGLTAMQWRPLVLIRYRGINTPAELSRHACIDTGAMTRALDRLEAKQFISRHRSPEDRRSVLIELTEAGNKVAEKILPAVAIALNTHLQGFSKEEVELLLSMLHRMLANGGQLTELDFIGR